MLHIKQPKNIKYHFFGKDCLIDSQLSDCSNLEKSLKELGFENQYRPLFVNQIHGNKTVIIDDIEKIYPQTPLPKADAIITNISNLTLSIITADCVPVLFFDSQGQTIGVAHAGWKGAKSGIVEAAIDGMIKLGAKIENISAIVGPSIRQKSYEVSEELYQEFISETQNNNKFFALSQKDGHFMFDLPFYVKERLKNKGITRIFDQELDTYSDPSLFSYRRSCHQKQEDCGRNVSVIMLSPDPLGIC